MSEQPATKADVARLEKRIDGVEQRIGGVEQRIGGVEQRIDGMEKSLRSEFRSELQAMERRLGLEIAHAINVGVEQIGKMIGVVDDKYRDLPGRVSALEEHAADASLHSRSPSPPAKRSRRRVPKKS